MGPKEAALNSENDVTDFHKFNQTYGENGLENCLDESSWRVQHGIVRDRMRVEDVSIKDKSARRRSTLEERKVEWKNRFAAFA